MQITHADASSYPVVESLNRIECDECKVVHPADDILLNLKIPILPADSPRSVREFTNSVFEVVQTFRT